VKFERAYLLGVNILARAFGVLGVLVGLFFLVNAYAIKENRAVNSVAGIFAIAIGGAALVAKSIRSEQIARIKRLMGRGE
jgi:hypothetical protein